MSKAITPADRKGQGHPVKNTSTAHAAVVHDTHRTKVMMSRAQCLAEACAEDVSESSPVKDPQRRNGSTSSRRRWLATAILLASLAVVLTIKTASGMILGVGVGNDISPGDRHDDLLISVYLVASDIEGYRAVHGDLPGEIGELGMNNTDHEWQYVKFSENDYSLSRTNENSHIVYESRYDLENWLEENNHSR